MKSSKKMIVADILCLVVAAIWGSGFIASQMALDANMSASLIMMTRFILAAVVMLIVCLPRLKRIQKREWKRGMLAGVFLYGAFFTQIIGQKYTTVSHCAFFTATNVVIVPFIVWIVSGKRPSLKTFALTAATLLGISVLSIQPGSFEFNFNFGDAMSLVCAVLFAMHIACLGETDADADVMLVNLVQLSTAAVISTVVYLLTDLGAASRVDWHLGLPAILFLGLFSTCLCYFLQTLAQKYTTPAQAGVLLSTEGLFGSLMSVLLGMEKVTANLIVGGLIILTVVVLMELPTKKRAKKI